MLHTFFVVDTQCDGAPLICIGNIESTERCIAYLQLLRCVVSCSWFQNATDKFNGIAQTAGVKHVVKVLWKLCGIEKVFKVGSEKIQIRYKQIQLCNCHCVVVLFCNSIANYIRTYFVGQLHFISYLFWNYLYLFRNYVFDQLL